MPGIPLKSGADFCVLEATRMRLHNMGEDPTEYGDGLVYFNTSEGKNTSKRVRIYDGTTFRSLAFLDEIANNEAFNALVGRVDEAEGDIDSLEGRATSLEGRANALEALFSGSNAKVADNALMLGGQLPSYYAQSSVLAQLRSEFDALYKTLNDDTTGVIDTWQEVVDFVNEYSGSEDLSTILAGMNTQIADRYTKAEADGRFLKLTGGVMTFNSVDSLIIRKTTNNLSLIRFDGFINSANTPMGYLGFYSVNNPVFYDTTTKPFALLHAGNYSGLITTLNKTLSVPSITIGGIKLSVVDGRLQIEGNAYATGELAAGGAGEEGSDDMGLALLENWADYDATKAQALGAVLGKDMYDRIVTLEGKSTNVQFTPTLASGKQIGAITIDGVTTGIFAPSSYAWSEITSKPTTLAGYGITDAIKADGSTPLVGSLTISSASDKKIVLNNTDADDKYQFISFCQNGVEYGSLGTTGDANLEWNSNLVLHSGNVGEYAALKDGSNASGTWGIDISGSAAKLGGIEPSRFMITDAKDVSETDFNQNLLSTNRPAIIRLGSISRHPNIPNPNLEYGYVLHVGHADKDTAWELVAGYATKTPLMFRAGTWKADGTGTINRNGWKTIAFTDSDITGNAATATKLQDDTAFTAWGQTFFENGKPKNIIGSLAFNANQKISWHGDANNYYITSAPFSDGLDPSIIYKGHGGHVFRTTSSTTRLLINPSGNVTIGESDLAGSDYKFVVNGLSRFKNNVESDGNIIGGGAVQAKSSAHGFVSLQVGSTGNKGLLDSRTSWFIYTNGTNTFLPLGNVLIGATTDNGAKLQVAGCATFSDRVLIKVVDDDGSSALSVAGALKVCRNTSSVDTFLEVTSNDNIVKYRGYDSSDGFCSHDFYSHDKLLLHISATNATSQFYTRLAASGLITASGGLYIPTGQSFKIGEATLSWDADKNALKVDKNIYSDDEVSAGGAGEEGETESTGNASAWAQTFTPTNTTMPFEHNRATTDVIVQVYEKNDGGSWDMILVDVEIISETKVNLHFGRTENREHKIVIMG